MENNGYIYELEVSGVRYVGKCEHLAYSRRLSAHLKHLEEGTHHNRLLQQAWTGPCCFDYRILEVTSVSRLEERETYWTQCRESVNAIPMRFIKQRLQQAVAREYAKGELSMRAIAKKFGISASSVVTYVRKWS